MKFPKDALSFFVGIGKLAARAKAQGNIGSDGQYIWDLANWTAFCRGVREYSHLQILGIGMAAYRTCLEVEAMIADEMDAESIHRVLAGPLEPATMTYNDATGLWYEKA